MTHSASSPNGEIGVSSISRRKFIAGATAAAPMILASGVFGANGRPGANDRIVTGFIGVGGKGVGKARCFSPSWRVRVD